MLSELTGFQREKALTIGDFKLVITFNLLVWSHILLLQQQTMVVWAILSSIDTLKYSKWPYNAEKFDQVLESCVEFILRFLPDKFSEILIFFFKIDAANSKSRYFTYYTCLFYQNYIILKGFVSFWMIGYSFPANFAVRPGFLHIFKEKSIIMNFSQDHSCFYGNRCNFYSCHDIGNLMLI